MKNSKCIYTVLVNDYDELRQPEAILTDWDYICFSNDIPEKQIGIWEIRRFDYNNAHSGRASHYPKLNPHLLLPNYDYSLYLDAKVALRQILNDRICQLVERDVSLAMIPHPERSCVYQEAMILTAWKVGDPKKIYLQTKFLLQNNFPRNYGFYDTAVLFRKHNYPDIVKFSQCWWELYNKFSSRDQMGVTYALHQARLTPEIMFPSSFYSKNIYPHKKKRKGISNLSFQENMLRYLAIIRLKILYYRYGIRSLKQQQGNHEIRK